MEKQIFKYIPLDYLQSCMVLCAQEASIPFSCFTITNKASYIEALKSLNQKNYNSVLIIYTGHGCGLQTKDYPMICPQDRAFDPVLQYSLININGEQINLGYIMDCCNNTGQPLVSENMGSSISGKASIRLLMKMEFRMLCMRKGLSNYKEISTFTTLLNSRILLVLNDYDFQTESDFFSILNYLILKNLKDKDRIINKKIRKVLYTYPITFQCPYNSQNLPIRKSFTNLPKPTEEVFDQIHNSRIQIDVLDNENSQYVLTNINSSSNSIFVNTY